MTAERGYNDLNSAKNQNNLKKKTQSLEKIKSKNGEKKISKSSN